ncbi:AAA family ATPase [Desulfobacterales bacterium HSG17]|nr:AAA family ATPase [Desulfobacterales bacterium HSG17]
MNNENKQNDPNKRTVSIKNLYLDPNNFRLIHQSDYVKVGDDKIKDKNIQHRTFIMLTGDKNQHIQDLLDSFKANDYLPVDQIQVRQLEDGGYVVIEGNRRIAALKYLHQKYNDNKIDLGNLNKSIFTNTPVVFYTDSNKIHHLTLMALKHISGNKKWGEWNQAKLIEILKNTHNLPENEICSRIGIKKVELRRTLRALSFIEQYIESDYGDQFNEKMFPLFREAIYRSNIKKWLNWEETEYKAENLENLELFFSWLSEEPDLEADGDMGYGDKYLPPALVKREDVRTLDKIINDKKAIAQLKLSRDINTAYRSSDHIFNERQQSAIITIDREIDTLNQMTIKGEYLPGLENTLNRLQGVVDRAKALGLSGVEQKTVFHDRIDIHFKSINILNYKLLKNTTLNGFSRINLFAGINNSGKTTLLEAVYLLCRQNDFTGLFEIVRRRGKISKDRINPEWFLEQIQHGIEIEGIFDNSSASVQIKHYQEENSGIDKSHYLESVEITSMYNGINQDSLTKIFKGRERETLTTGTKILCPVVYSSPFFLNEPHRYASYYHKSTQSKALPKIFEFIKKTVIDTIEDVRLVDEWQRFLVTDSCHEYAIDLTGYGEGLQRIFFISLLFASAQNGVLLIDEFENAIHTDLISKFTEFIHGLAVLFNVQVFITSHSKECIDAFVKNIPKIEDLFVCALVEGDKGIKTKEYTGSKYRRMLEAGNIDIRRAK